MLFPGSINVPRLQMGSLSRDIGQCDSAYFHFDAILSQAKVSSALQKL